MKLRQDDGDPLLQPTRYRKFVGSLMYLFATRLDISHAVHVPSEFFGAPTSTHYAALLRVLRYFRGTMTLSLLFPSDFSLTLRAYSDAGWRMIWILVVPLVISTFFLDPSYFLAHQASRIVS